jgi:hypothetical protein
MSRIRHTFTTICALVAVLSAGSSASPAQSALVPAPSVAASARQCPRPTVQTPPVTAPRIDSFYVTLPAIPAIVTGTCSIKRFVWPITAAAHRPRAVGGAVPERSIDSTSGQRPPAPARPPPRRLAHLGQRNRWRRGPRA